MSLLVQELPVDAHFSDVLPGATRSARVLLISMNYSPEETGIALYATAYADWLASSGHEVTVIAGLPHYPRWTVAEGYGKAFQVENHHGVEVRRVWHHVPRRQTIKGRAMWELSYAAGSLAAAALAPRPDVILAITPCISAALVASAASRIHGAPYGLIYQDLPGKAITEVGLGGRGLAAFVQRVEHETVKSAKSIGIVSDGFRDYLVSRGAKTENVHHMPNWSLAGSATAAPGDTRERIGWPLDKTVCLHAGNMGAKQGLESVVECAAMAQESDPRLEFVLMGDGNQRRHIEELIRGKRLTNIRVMPLQPAEDVPDLLAAADLLLVNQRPSVTDMSLPSKLTAYMLAGRPVIAAAAATSETAKLIVAGGAGSVVDPGQPAKLLAEIRRVAANDALSRRLATSARQFAEANFRPEAGLRAFDRFFADLSGIPAKLHVVPPEQHEPRWTPHAPRAPQASAGRAASS